MASSSAVGVPSWFWSTSGDRISTPGLPPRRPSASSREGAAPALGHTGRSRPGRTARPRAADTTLRRRRPPGCRWSPPGRPGGPPIPAGGQTRQGSKGDCTPPGRRQWVAATPGFAGCPPPGPQAGPPARWRRRSGSPGQPLLAAAPLRSLSAPAGAVTATAPAAPCRCTGRTPASPVSAWERRTARRCPSLVGTGYRHR